MFEKSSSLLIYPTNALILSTIILFMTLNVLAGNILQQHASAQTTGDLSSYEKYGIKIKYPTSWTVKEDILSPTKEDPTPSFFVRFDSNDNVDGYSPDLTIMNLTEAEPTVLLFSNMQNIINGVSGKHYSFISEQSLEINGNPAKETTYTYNDKDYGKLQVMEVFVSKGTTYYDISYTSTPDRYLTFLPTAEKMLSSFEVTNSPADTTAQQQQQNITSQQVPSSHPPQQSGSPFL